ncbi:pyridine nucleotide-disulfide oxidoreductase-like protein [Lentithecium fluviatile CBS 122367]|uniref:Pyridine nucleotide-disulfide oxidoreductase-like protein n=1 Tax=Lentithecium fluviatile CBS 122367 TaxID=1168545 RepID=A0A6G1JBL3_9PLEO|nr:pyridine nucleotide-disulfide oxidoreductase-like protein [Lentithecium fluviatile CBS 122367]
MTSVHRFLRLTDPRRTDRERVVILGSGWAGYTVARELDAKKYQAVVVSPRSYFVFTPLLASTSVGTLEFRTALEPVRTRRRTNFSFFQGWADSVDFKAKKISIEEAVDDPASSLALTECRKEARKEREDEKRMETRKGKLFDLTYDKLIITVGCYSQTFGIPGVKKHALFLKDVGDARKIRSRLLACFEAAALPTTTDEQRRRLLNFAVVGAGPTGIEFSAELHDIIREDLARIYPELVPFHKITVYDVAPKVLPMFDEKLGKYAMDTFRREGIFIKTSHHVEELRPGAPGEKAKSGDHSVLTLKVKEEGEIGVGMVVWSTGLMQNPFVANALDGVKGLPKTFELLKSGSEKIDADSLHWKVKKDDRTGSIMTDSRLHIKLTTSDSESNSHAPEAILKDVYAIGDCAIIEGTSYPATAQVASQKASWLAKRLNKGDMDEAGFSFKNMGVMAYIGNWNALFQGSGGGNISGRTAFLIWRGAYLTKSVSWRNKILIPVYWMINWMFGRDISRF